jgi:acid phosphatase (class A)
VGLVLAELRPEHAADVLVRARAFGESRVVCGVHNASALDGAYVDGAALVASLHGDAAFHSDLEASRKELAALRAATPAGCPAEASLTAKTPW